MSGKDIITTDSHQYRIISTLSETFIDKKPFQTVMKANIADEQTPSGSYLLIRKISKLCGVDASIIDREIKTVQAASLYKEPNFTTILDFKEFSSYYLIVTPFFNKASLTDVINQGDIISEGIAIEYFQKICYTIKVLASKGVTPSGLSSDSIMINLENGIISTAIYDFGLNYQACASMHNLPSLITNAPEAFNGDNDQSTTVYSLGCIYYYLLTGKALLLGKSESEIQENQKKMISLTINCKWEASKLSMEILEGCLQYSAKNRMSFDELSALLGLNTLYSNRQPLNLGSISTKKSINLDERTDKDMRILKVSDETPKKIYDVENICKQLDAIKSKQIQIEEENANKDKSYMLLRNELDNLKKGLLTLDSERDNTELSMQSKIIELQEEIKEIKNTHTYEINKMQTEINSRQDGINQRNSLCLKDNSKLLTDQLEAHKQEISIFRKSIELEVKKIQSEAGKHPTDKSPSKLENSYSKEAIQIELNALQSQINQILENQKHLEFLKDFKEYQRSLDTHKNELNNIKNSIIKENQQALAIELNKLHQLQQPKENSPSKDTSALISKKINEIMETQKNEFKEIKKVYSTLSIETFNTEINRLQSQINQILENQNYLMEFKEFKANIALIDKHSKDLLDVRKQISLIQADPIYTDIINIKTQLVGLSEGLHARISAYFSESKAYLEFVSSNKLELSDIRKSISNGIENYKLELNKLHSALRETIAETAAEVNEIKGEVNNIDSLASDIFKIKEQLNSSNDAFNGKITKCVSDCKLLIEPLDSKSMEINELKKELLRIKTEIIPDEYQKVQEQFNQLQESVIQRNNSHIRETKVLSDTMEKLKLEIMELKISLSKGIDQLQIQNTSNEIAKLQTELATHKDEVYLKLDSLSESNRQTLESLEKQGSDLAELNEAFIPIQSNTCFTDIKNISNQLLQLQDAFNTEINSLNKDTRELHEYNDKAKLEYNEMKKALAKQSEQIVGNTEKIQSQLVESQSSSEQLDINTKELKELKDNNDYILSELDKSKKCFSQESNGSKDISKLQSLVIQMQDSVNEKFATYSSNHSKQIEQCINAHKEDVDKIKKSISKIESCHCSFDYNKISLQISELQQCLNQKCVEQCENSKAVEQKLRLDIAEIKKSVEEIYDGNANSQELADINKQINELKNRYSQESSNCLIETKNLSVLVQNINSEILQLKNSVPSNEPSEKELNKINEVIYQLQESINHTIIRQSDDEKLISDDIDMQKQEIADIKKIVNGINEQTNLVGNAEINAKIKQMADLIKDVTDHKSTLESSIKMCSDLSSSYASLKSIVSSLMKSVSAIESDYSSVIRRMRTHESQILKINDSMDSESPKYGIRSFEKSSHLDLASKVTPPWKETNSYLFRTSDRVLMKIEITLNKIVLSELNGAVKYEIIIDDINTLKLDESNRCVVLGWVNNSNQSQLLTPTKNGAKMYLYKDTLPDAIDLYKFIRNSYLLKSEKKLMLSPLKY